MRFPAKLTTGVLIRRYKRFLADVELDNGEVVTAHVPNTGSMLSTRNPGGKVAISPAQNPERELKWTLELVRVGASWVGVNTARSNHVVEAAIAAKRIGPLRGYANIRREVRCGERSRIDLLLEGKKGSCYVEVKNVTYRVGRRALFPDAVTERGAKHLRELREMVRQGHRGVIFFLINRDDCASFAPAREIDPVYGELLDEVVAGGVEALAYSVKNTVRSSDIERKIRIVL